MIAYITPAFCFCPRWLLALAVCAAVALAAGLILTLAEEAWRWFG